MPETNVLALPLAEFTVVAHLRGWCHDSRECAVCCATLRAHRAERALDQIIAG